MLPSITCSSCGHPIPLSSLQEHICQPSASSSRPAAASGRRTPQPPASKESERRARPTLQTNATYSHPPRPLEPPRPSYQTGGVPKSASPTNPFFPHPERTPSPKVGQGYGPVAAAELQQPQPTESQPDTTSGGGAGMAGVGRRAFAAAAWGVRLGVSLAAKGDDRVGINSGNDLPPPTHTPNSASPHSAGSSGPREYTRPSQTPAEYTASLVPTAAAESMLSRSAPADAAAPRSITAIAATSKLPFFERYKQMASSSSSIRSASPIAKAEDAELLTESADEGAFDYDDDSDSDDGRRSALPWASPNPAEPVIGLGSLAKRSLRGSSRSRKTERPRQKGSSISSSSSSRSRHVDSTSGSEEVVTPSTSYEGGLSEKAGLVESIDKLENIGEEAEDEEVVFAPSHQLRRSVQQEKVERAPERRVVERQRKTCQNCGDVVGGQRRFVERDGVVLCERDWKKLYLPSCRRCSQPIEKSAVSSSDGQLKGKWHRACFTCTRCDKPFAGDDFYVHGGKPWCQHHYHEEK